MVALACASLVKVAGVVLNSPSSVAFLESREDQLGSGEPTAQKRDDDQENWNVE